MKTTLFILTLLFVASAFARPTPRTVIHRPYSTIIIKLKPLDLIPKPKSALVDESGNSVSGNESSLESSDAFAIDCDPESLQSVQAEFPNFEIEVLENTCTQAVEGSEDPY